MKKIFLLLMLCLLSITLNSCDAIDVTGVWKLVEYTTVEIDEHGNPYKATYKVADGQVSENYCVVVFDGDGTWVMYTNNTYEEYFQSSDLVWRVEWVQKGNKIYVHGERAPVFILNGNYLTSRGFSNRNNSIIYTFAKK